MDVLNYLHSITLSVALDNLLVMLVVIILICFIIWIIFNCINKGFKRNFKIVNMNIKIANIGDVSIEVNRDISNIAHKAWVEIMTRKVGLVFEDDKDVIVEVYNSWYALFGIIRELLKDIELRKQDKNMEKLEEVLIKTLNNGLRPHLTKWQAKYRRWYNQEIEKEENKALSPQKIQKKYSQYNELISDLKETNKQMVQFAEELKKLV